MTGAGWVLIWMTLFLFNGIVDIMLLNQGKVLTHPVLKEDYIHIWKRKEWNINPWPYTWWNYLHLKKSPITPVKISFLDLTMHCFEKFMLFALTLALETSLKLNGRTANLSWPSVAHVLVKVDASKIYKECIQIEMNVWILSPVLFNMSKYCSYKD